jgi:PAS domain S-box-containing protein
VSDEATATSAQRERYRIFIEDVADGFFETDLKGRFLFFNDALCRIFGRDRDEIEQASFRRFMDPPDAQQAFDDFNHLFKTGDTVKGLQWKIRRPSGELRYLETHANLIEDGSGKPTGFRGIARDVSDRHLAQQALKESEQCTLEMYRASHRAEQRYRALLEFFPEPVIVLNRQNQVSYINPAFVRLFGWTHKELSGRRIPFIPEALKMETIRGTQQLFESKVIHGYKTQRLTRDGRLLDVVLDAAVYYEADEAAGVVVTLRDKTEQERLDRVNKALFEISQALYRFRGLDDRLAYITNQIRELLDVKGASVIMLDERRREFFFRVTDYGDAADKNAWREIRFPADKGVAGHVVRTGKPLIVPDTSQSEYFFSAVDEKTNYRTENMLDVPLKTQDRIIGVLCAVNKREGGFGDTDVELLTTIANMVALPLENARINEALNKSYEALKTLSRAQERVIHHLSHELKTPISVLSASLGLLGRKIASLKDPAAGRIIKRSQRNLSRLLDMQYEIEDILKSDDYRNHAMLSRLLESSADMLEVMVAENLDQNDIIERLRQRIDEEFLPTPSPSMAIQVDQFARERLADLKPRFSHRRVHIETDLQTVPEIILPADVLEKVFDGILRNAVENTPDGGLINVAIRSAAATVTLTVQDFGIGVTAEKHRLISDGFVGTEEISQYSSRRPFDFGAGGRGFDLLRTKIFAERYGFELKFKSRRCRFIPEENDRCPGAIADCLHCDSEQTCLQSGGTTVTVIFPLPDGDKQAARSYEPETTLKA